MRTSLLALVFLPLLAHAEVRLGVSGGLMHAVLVGEGIRVTGPATQPETVQWQNAVLANGGAFDGTDVRAVDYFISQCKVQGIWPLLDWVTLFAGRNLSAALVPVKRGTGFATMTNHSFTEIDFSPSWGLTGDGESKYLDPGLSVTAVGARNNKSFGVFLSAIGTGNANLMSSSGASNGQITLARTASTLNTRLHSGSGPSTIGAMVPGFVGVSRVDSGSIFYQTNSEAGIAVQASANMTAGAIMLFATNAPSLFFNGTIAGAFYGLGLSAQELIHLSAIYHAAMTLLGRPAF